MLQFKILKVSFVVFLSYLIFIPVSYADNTYKVKPTDSLSRVVDKFYKGSELSRYQIYIGLLAENPNAFRLGNINYLKSSQVLNLPDSNGLLAMEAADAANLVAEHNDKAKQGKRSKIDPPFKNYSPKGASHESNDISALTEKQQSTNQELKKLDSETEALRIRLEKLVADKEAMDAELQQLNSLIKQ